MCPSLSNPGQWAAQFYVAAELTRRGYLTSLTFGNAPVADILAVSPHKTHFMIDVKGLSSKNFILIKEMEVRSDLYYILVYLPAIGNNPEYFIINSREVQNRIANLKEKVIARGRSEWGSGINWGMAQEFKDRWDTLPK